MTPLRLLVLAGLAQVALTFLVELVLYIRRFAEMKRRRIDPQSVATSRQSAEVVEDLRASDNFKNLFEMPVLFYFLCALAAATDTATEGLAYLGWLFVGLRALHSMIQIGSNRVTRRFLAFIASSLTLLAMWVIVAVKFLAPT